MEGLNCLGAGRGIPGGGDLWKMRRRIFLRVGGRNLKPTDTFTRRLGRPVKRSKATRMRTLYPALDQFGEHSQPDKSIPSVPNSAAHQDYLCVTVSGLYGRLAKGEAMGDKGDHLPER